MELSKGKRERVFCSDKCRKAYNRRKDTPKTDKAKTDITEQVKTDTINRWGKDVGEMDAQTLYAYIGAYQKDDWKDGPEFKELIKRLNSKPLKTLKAEGYWIPNRLEPKAV